MTSEVEIPVEERILQVLQHLGIEKAHFAARRGEDWRGLARAYPDCMVSLTLICPRVVDPDARGALSSRLLVFSGDQGAYAPTLPSSMASLPQATSITLRDYASHIFADAVADRTDEVAAAMLDFLARMTDTVRPEAVTLPQGDGEVAGVSYHIRGSGVPLVLLPLDYSSYQWEPLLPRLSDHYCTITLAGAHLGAVGSLEARGRAPGYIGMVRSLLEETQLQPGEEVLDVGCGSGFVERWLARSTNGANRIVAVDISPYLLREAKSLASREGLEGMIEFQEGDAESLPFPDNSFDVVMLLNVLPEADTDRILAELVRVTRPKGRVAVETRADDRPFWVNLPLSDALKLKVETSGGARARTGELGCSDASLYRRFHQVGLTQVKMLPYLVADYDRFNLQFLQGQILPSLSPEELKEWELAVAQAEAERTFFIARPFHCAVGTKPG